jgi:hypothetical protein
MSLKICILYPPKALGVCIIKHRIFIDGADREYSIPGPIELTDDVRLIRSLE